MPVNQVPKPFIKYPGGKTQLLPELIARLPSEFTEGKITQYIEPFVGGSALFFEVTKMDVVDKLQIGDCSFRLIQTYRAIKDSLYKVLTQLRDLDGEYKLLDEEQRAVYYYQRREEFNGNSWRNAALFIFLNKTCYNGLYRVNTQGKFNVPYGKYKNPKIYNAENLTAVSEVLKDTVLNFGDFANGQSPRWEVDCNTFFYFDPPYRPVSKTSRFNAYAGTFDDQDQIRLAEMFKRLDSLGAKLMLSNSDTGDGFFQKLYKGFNISRVKARRAINSVGSKRGKVSELIITNY